MNLRRYLLIAALVAPAVRLLTLVTTTKSMPGKAEVQANTSRLILEVEPAVRMQSGAIEFSDSNSPDFRSHISTFQEPGVDVSCISDESASQRRFGGCVE